MTNKAQQDLLNQLNEYRQTQQLDEIPGKFGQAMSNIGRDLKGVAYDAVARDGYDWRQGVRSQSDPIKTPNAPGTQTPAAGAQTGKRVKTGGKVAGQTSNTASAQQQRDARAAKKGSIATGIGQAQAGQQTKPGLNIKPGATAVPGQKAPTQGDHTHHACHAFDKNDGVHLFFVIQMTNHDGMHQVVVNQ